MLSFYHSTQKRLFMKIVYFFFCGLFFLTACDDKPKEPVLPAAPVLTGETGTTITGNLIKNNSGNIKFNVGLPKETGLGWDLKYAPVLAEQGDAIRLNLQFGNPSKQNMLQEMVLQDSVLNQQGKVELSLKSFGFSSNKSNNISQLKVNYIGEYGNKTVRIIPLDAHKTVIDTYTIAANKQTAQKQNDSRGVYCYQSYNRKWVCVTRWDASNKVYMQGTQQETVLITIEPLDSNGNIIDYTDKPSIVSFNTNNIEELNIISSPSLSIAKLSGANPNSNVLIPIHAKNATFGAMSIEILYNPNVLIFKGLTNMSTPGIQASANNGILKIVWVNASGFTWSDTKITDLQFTYKGGASSLQFLPDTETSKPDGRIVSDLNLNNGSVE